MDKWQPVEIGLLQRACEACRTEFTSTIDAARDEMWHRLPVWFGVEGVGLALIRILRMPRVAIMIHLPQFALS